MMAASETVLSPSDPASSLRAAALSTIKRRKNLSTDTSLPGGKATLPSRPAAAHDNSVQLDYGQEDATSSSQYKSPPRKPALLRPKVLDVDPSQGREEGEISDSEDLPPIPPKENTRPPATAPASLPSRPGLPTLVAGRPARMEVTPPPRSAIPKVESPATHNLLDRMSNLPSSLRSSSHGPDLPLPQENQLDEHHVRPGLTMSQAQYDTAKDIVLDLLGWGVAPEFLVDCGLSREIVFYVFSELRLRLPTNLDITGLTHYPPNPHILDEPFHWPPMPTHKAPSSPTIKSELSSATELKFDPVHSPPAISRKAVNKASPVTFISTESPSSGSTPLQTSVAATPVMPTLNVNPSPHSTNLHDMERQRRQELLARKAAAQASRKSKQTSMAVATSLSSSSSANSRAAETQLSSSLDVETKPTTPTPALSVDDFLNSIAPSSSNGDSTDMTVDESSERHASPDAMDVDVPPPTSGADQSNGSSSGTGDLLPPPVSPAEPPPMSADTDTDVALPSGSTTDLNSFAAAQDTFVLDSGGSGVREQNPDLPPRPLTQTSTGSSTPNANGADLNQLTGLGMQRRGTKRPVAADFVDFDGSDGQNRRLQWNTQGPAPSTSTANDRTLRRRLTGTNGNTPSAMGGFASVSGMRRCIIDLSDSDGEADGDDGPSLFRPDHRARYSPSIVGFRPGTITHSGRATPTVSTPPVVPPSSLIEKEEEIRRMRELIAQREQKRMQKLAMTRSVSAVLDASPSVDASTTANATLDGQLEPKPNPDHGNIEASPILISQDGVPEHEDAPRTPDRPKQSGSADTITDGTDVRKEIPPSVSVDDVNSSISSTQATDEQIMHPLGSSDQAPPKQEESLSSSDKSEAVLFPSYESPFGRYPLLRSSISTHLPSDPSASSSSSSSSTFIAYPDPSASSPPSVDLEPLRLATWLKNTNPSQQICRFEIPGGGVCRDSECEDVHLKSSNRGARAAEPGDDDTARYLCDRLPRSWVEDRHIGEDDIRAALLATSGMVEERVQHALWVLHQERELR